MSRQEDGMYGHERDWSPDDREDELGICRDEEHEEATMEDTNHTCGECIAWMQKFDGLCMRQRCVCYMGANVRACDKFAPNKREVRNGDR